MKYAEVQEFGNQNCNQKFDNISNIGVTIPDGIRKSQICVIPDEDENGNIADACQGDGGAPLIYYDKQEMTTFLTGTSSFGLGCGISGFPSVYTRVSSYIGWIESIVWPEY